VRSGNRRNCLVIALLVLLPAAELVTHLAHLGRVALAPWLGVQLGLDSVLFIIAVMAGRVVPMFTNMAWPAPSRGELAGSSATS
jgi:uncharacterized protein involved in response to NO